MSSTSRNHNQNSKIMPSLTEVDEATATSRKRLKGMFLEKDKMQMSSYIKDLEKTVALNKAIISDLISADKNDSDVIKKSFEKLNTENANLQTQIKKAMKQRDDVQARLLICEQIVEELRGREKDLESQYLEKNQEMLDQLNRKEYVLQCYEKRYHKALNLLRKYSEKDGEVRLLLKEIHTYDGEQKCISNVLEENEALATEVKTAREKVAMLGSKFTELAIDAAKGSIVSVKQTGSIVGDTNSIPLQIKKSSATKNPSTFARKEASAAAAEAKALTELVSQLQNDKEIIGESIKKLTEENEEIKKTNEILHKENEELKQKLSASVAEMNEMKKSFTITLEKHRKLTANHKDKEMIGEGNLPIHERKESVLAKKSDILDISSINEEYKDAFLSFDAGLDILDVDK